MGDLIIHYKYGRGIILGNYHKRPDGYYYYHIHYDNKTFGYNRETSLQLRRERDELTIGIAKQILLSTLS